MFLTMLVCLRPYCAQNPSAATSQQAGQDGSIGLPQAAKGRAATEELPPPRRQSGNGLSAAEKAGH